MLGNVDNPPNPKPLTPVLVQGYLQLLSIPKKVLVQNLILFGGMLGYGT